MTKPVTRRDFLKITGMGAGIAAVLTGCGPASRYVLRQPYSEMPEFTMTGTSTYFATTCGECSAGCGLIVRTTEGRAHKVDGNPQHPVDHGGTCSRGQATLQGVYNPDRVQGPGKQSPRGSGTFENIDWTAAISTVKDALQNNTPAQIAFLTGLFPDHLHDLIQLISAGLGGANVYRFGTLGEYEERDTLMAASKTIFGVEKIPLFDIENSGVVFSFGANFLETWLSPVFYIDAYGTMRQGHTGRRGYFVQFEPRISQTGASADEWYPITPGSEALLAQGFGKLVAEQKSIPVPGAFANVDISQVVQQTGVPETDMRRLASIFASTGNPLAVPGGIPLGCTNGKATAESILALNVLVDNLGKEGGIFLMPDTPLYPELSYRPSTSAEIIDLIDKMKNGEIKVLFVHGTNPVYELPKSLGFTETLQKVPLVISFASFPDETAMQADLVLPDNTPPESWGYQKIVTGSDRSTVSGLQPVVVPLYNTKPTADVLLGAVQAIGGKLAASVPYTDEVDFLQKSVATLIDKGGFYTAPTVESFWTHWQQYGGWWKAETDLVAPQASTTLDQPMSTGNARFSGNPAEFPFYLISFPSPNLGDGSAANRPMLQEIQDPMTTVMWNTWVEINPATLQQLGLHSDEVITITSPAGEVQAAIYEYPGINPGVIAIPLGQGHTAFGRYAKDRGINARDLLDKMLNEVGNLAFMATRVKISPTGKYYKLSRYESFVGVYLNPFAGQGE